MVAESLVAEAECEAQLLAPRWLREETASLVCIPSFGPEWALSIVGGKEGGLLGCHDGGTRKHLVFDEKRGKNSTHTVRQEALDQIAHRTGRGYLRYLE